MFTNKLNLHKAQAKIFRNQTNNFSNSNISIYIRFRYENYLFCKIYKKRNLYEKEEKIQRVYKQNY
jgi:hypothetical protein